MRPWYLLRFVVFFNKETTKIRERKSVKLYESAIKVIWDMQFHNNISIKIHWTIQFFIDQIYIDGHNHGSDFGNVLTLSNGHYIVVYVTVT